MGSKTLDIARLEADPAPTWRSEGAAVTQDDAVFSQVQLDAQDLSVEVVTSRELAQAKPERPAEVPAPRVRPRNSPDPGDFFVQVFAGRNESSAAELVQQLEGSGYRVDLQTRREVAGTLFKVRVGGFETMDIARNMAQELKGRGYAGAWVPNK